MHFQRPLHGCVFYTQSLSAHLHILSSCAPSHPTASTNQLAWHSGPHNKSWLLRKTDLGAFSHMRHVKLPEHLLSEVRVLRGLLSTNAYTVQTEIKMPFSVRLHMNTASCTDNTCKDTHAINSQIHIHRGINKYRIPLCYNISCTESTHTHTHTHTHRERHPGLCATSPATCVTACVSCWYER